MERGYKAGPGHLCSMCGQWTRSKLPVCCRPGKCLTEYKRLRTPAQRQRSLRTPAHPCSLCGQLTTSRFQVCAGPSCVNEYRRLERAAQKGTPSAQADKERRNEQVRRHRQRQKGKPSVYAAWFPAPQVLKVGFTMHTQDSIFIGTARHRARRHGWETDGTTCIWKQPGDMRTEAWIQATLSFRWQAGFEQKHDRLCEWFHVPGLTEDAIIGVLNEVYGLVPADLTDSTPAVLSLVI